MSLTICAYFCTLTSWFGVVAKVHNKLISTLMINIKLIGMRWCCSNIGVVVVGLAWR